MANINQENQLNNFEFKKENNENLSKISNINNIIQVNFQELLTYIRRMNEQFLNSLLFNYLLANNNNFTLQYLGDNIILNKEQGNAFDAIFKQNMLK